MNSRRHLGLVAAAATLLAAAPIATIFESFSWLVSGGIAVAAVAGAAMGARSLRGRVWAQVAAMLGALLLALTLLDGGGTAFLGLIPTLDTFAYFNDLLVTAGDEIQTSAVPVGDLDGLLFLTTLGIGAVAIVVDLCAVGLRRPALAGLPMLAIYSVPVAVYPDSVSPIPFVIGSIGFLWLLVSDNVDRVRRFGRRFTGEGRGVDVWEPSPLAATGRRLAVAGVLAAVVLPIAVPSMTSGFFNRFGTGQGSGPGGSGSGGTGSVNLFAELSGKLRQTNIQEMVRIRTTDNHPFYVRFGVADDVADSGFRYRAPTGRPVGGQLPQPTAVQVPGVTTFRHSANVEVLKSFDMPLLPIYSTPVSTRNLDASWSYDQDMQLIFSQRARSAGRSYEFDYVRSEFTAEQLRTSLPLPAADRMRQFNRVPEVPEVRAEVDRLIKGKTTVYDQVRAIYNFFSAKNGFAYDLSAPVGTSGKAITDFLSGKRGFCEQYAAALTWMVRTAGIPARVAFGFTLGSQFTDGTYTLTTRNLHAWTEVYFAGFGWVPFDATPSNFVSGSVTTAWAPNVDAPETAPGQAAPSFGPAPSGGPGEDGPDKRPGEEGDLGLGSGSAATPTPPWVWWTAGGLALALILLSLPALRRRSLRRRRGTTPRRGGVAGTGGTPDGVMTVLDGDAAGAGRDGDADRRWAHAVWDELIDTMIDFRVPVDPAETPRATAERLVRQERLPEPVGADARLLGRAEERARYAPTPLGPEQLAVSLAGVRAFLSGQATRRVRLMAALLPPSVLQRWRAAVNQATTRGSVRLSTISEATLRMRRPLRLRRLFR